MQIACRIKAEAFFEVSYCILTNLTPQILQLKKDMTFYRNAFKGGWLYRKKSCNVSSFYLLSCLKPVNTCVTLI